MISHEAYAKLLTHWTAACAKPIPKHTGPIVKEKQYLKWLEAHRAKMKARDELWSDNPIKKFYERRNKDAKATNPKI